jgi:predicted ATPase/transcriptional regulator with XRE-family HTH domain
MPPTGHTPTTFGAVLQRLRRAAGLSQEELAERAGLSARGISDLERGVRHAPRPATLRLLADALDLDETQRARLTASAFAGPTEPTVAPASTRAVFPAVAGSLPHAAHALVGREGELADLVDRLRDPRACLVTLTGPGGVGKTRLAVQAAIELRTELLDAVAFIPLAAIRDSSLVLPTVAQALGMRDSSQYSSEEGLVTMLQGRRSLLILDNFEQVLDASPLIARWLASCPGLQLLITSRVALNLAQEQRYPVAPLAVPDPAPYQGSSGVATSPSVQLFVQRARHVRPDFNLTPGNTEAVAAICRRLDGLPLAIELAAARTAVLPAQALLDRMERALPLLTGGARDQPERLRTMRNAIAWSYDALSPAAQALFRRLAVFQGGFCLDAAEAVHVATGEAWDSVFDGIAELVEASLLRSEDGPGGDPRFSMLETIREYGLDQLAASGEEQTVRELHAAWVLSFVERAEPELFRLEQRTWGERLEAERPNIRAALAWFERITDAERALRLAGILPTFGWARGHLRESQEWLQRALAIPGESSAAARAWAILGISTLAYFQGNYDLARTMAEEGLAIARDGGFALGMGWALHMLADTAWMQEDLPRARALGESVIAQQREAGHPGLLAISLGDMGMIALYSGDRARGEAWSAEGLALCRALGNRWYIANHIGGQGDLAQAQGNLERAVQCYRESLPLFLEVDDRWYVASPIAGVAAIAVAHGRLEAAARLLGVAAGLNEVSGSAPGPWDQGRDEQTAAALQRDLGEVGFARAFAIGRGLPIDQAVAEAMAILDGLADEDDRDGD